MTINPTFDAAIRRKLRQKLGSRTMRRNGTKSHRLEKPRQKLAALVVQWAEEQARRLERARMSREKDDAQAELERAWILMVRARAEQRNAA